MSERVSIRRPHYGEIHRSIPYVIFKSMTRILNAVDDFREPFCYLAKNNKAEVISFTSLSLLTKLFSFLSGLLTKDIKTFFSRTLSGKKNLHKVKIIVSDTKDFAFFYKVNNGQLIIQFHYGEWNAHGCQQHA